MNFVCAVGLGAAALVLHGVGARRLRRAVQLHDIGDAGKAEAARHDLQAAHGALCWPRFMAGFVHALVHHLALGGEAILRPDALDMDQRALARAIKPMLERRERDEIVGFRTVHERAPWEEPENLDAGGNVAAIDAHVVIGVGACWRPIMRARIADRMRIAIEAAMDADASEQILRVHCQARIRA